MFCQFLLYSKVTQSCIYMHSFPSSCSITSDTCIFPVQELPVTPNPRLPTHPIPSTARPPHPTNRSLSYMSMIFSVL